MTIANGPLWMDVSFARPCVCTLSRLSKGGVADRIQAAGLAPVAGILLPLGDALANAGLALAKMPLLATPLPVARWAGVDVRKLDPVSPKRALVSQLAFHVMRVLASLAVAVFSTITLPFIIAMPTLVVDVSQKTGMVLPTNEMIIAIPFVVYMPSLVVAVKTTSRKRAIFAPNTISPKGKAIPKKKVHQDKADSKTNVETPSSAPTASPSQNKAPEVTAPCQGLGQENVKLQLSNVNPNLLKDPFQSRQRKVDNNLLKANNTLTPKTPATPSPLPFPSPEPSKGKS